MKMRLMFSLGLILALAITGFVVEAGTIWPVPDRLPAGHPIRLHLVYANVANKPAYGCCLEVVVHQRGCIDWKQVTVEAVNFTPLAKPEIAHGYIVWNIGSAPILPRNQIEIIVTLPTIGGGTAEIKSLLVVLGPDGHRQEISGSMSVVIDDVSSEMPSIDDEFCGVTWEPYGETIADGPLCGVAMSDGVIYVAVDRGGATEILRYDGAWSSEQLWPGEIDGLIAIKESIWANGRNSSGVHVMSEIGRREGMELAVDADITAVVFTGDEVMGGCSNGLLHRLLPERDVMAAGGGLRQLDGLVAVGRELFAACCDVLWQLRDDAWVAQAAAPGAIADIGGGRRLVVAVHADSGFEVFSFGENGVWTHEWDVSGQEIMFATGGTEQVAIVVDHGLLRSYMADAPAIALSSGSPLAWTRGIRYELATVPEMFAGQLYAGVRDVVELLGGNVHWCSEARAAICNIGQTRVVIGTGSITIDVEGTSRVVDSSSRVDGGRLVMAVREWETILGYTIKWCDRLQTARFY